VRSLDFFKMSDAFMPFEGMASIRCNAKGEI